MKITRIKPVHWYDAKAKQDTTTYKVWLDNQGQVELRWFNTETELADFQQSLERNNNVHAHRKTTSPKTKKN